MRSAREVAAVGLTLLIACQSPGDATFAVQCLALDTLFNGREHARELAIWSSDSAGPVLEQISRQKNLTHQRTDVRRLAPTLPATAIDEATIARMFREHADGWAEFFRRFPHSSGLVELSPPHFSSGNSVGEMYVGRSCGPHCQNAWRVVARRAVSL